MKILEICLIILILLPALVLAESQEFGNVSEIESSYNVQTLITKDYAYIILRTESPGECEYGTEEFKYGEGGKFEDINGTFHKAKIKIEKGKSYQFKIKCVVEGKSGEEDIAFSVSHITFFLLETLEDLKRNVVDFKDEKTKYENKVDTKNIEQKISELEDTIKEAEKCIENNDINKLREKISEGIRKKNEIETLFTIKSIQISIMEKSKYVVLFILVAYLIAYFLTSFCIPYCRLTKNLKKLREKKKEMKKLRKSTELMYFNRRIDEDTFNKMVIKEQEEIMRLRVKISTLEKKKKDMIKNLFKPKTIMDWSMQEKIHIRDWIKKLIRKINK